MSNPDIDRPFFSIGVTTYDRKDMLRETVSSLLGQTFTGFEIIIGNDFIAEPLTAEMLGFDDPRIRIVNHPRNLGELDNMNALLGLARGRYFSWQFDDDPCAPTFLHEAWLALTTHEFPPCVFTQYEVVYGASRHRFTSVRPGASKLLSGKNFLRGYLSGTIQALGCCGVYSTEYLRGIGGAPRLSAGSIALLAEFLLLIRVGMLPRVAYVDVPLVTTRAHEGSWTTSNREAELFKQAGLNLISESLVILLTNELAGDFRQNLEAVLSSIVSMVVVKIYLNDPRTSRGEIDGFVNSLAKVLDTLAGTPLHDDAVAALEKIRSKIPAFRMKAYFKSALPWHVFGYLRLPISIIKKHLTTPF